MSRIQKTYVDGVPGMKEIPGKEIDRMLKDYSGGGRTLRHPREIIKVVEKKEDENV